MKKVLTLFLSSVFTLSISLLLFTGCSESSDAEPSPHNDQDMVYELRTYTTHEGRLDALHQRFENHTMELFEKHGMTNIDYWVPIDPELKDNTLIYVVAHESVEAAEESWESFISDPEWQQVYEESHADGEIVSRVESVFIERVPYSPLNR